MATPPDVIRAELAAVTTAASAELSAIVAAQSLESQVSTALAVVPVLVPSYYDAAGALAVAWYDELRTESAPTSTYAPSIIGEPETDWIEREAAKFRADLDAIGLDIEAETQKMLDEITRLTEKEVSRGYRSTITGNSTADEDAIGWSRIARPGACKFCLMLADKGAVYRKDTVNFAAHTNCHCASRPAFRNGEHGPEASVEQYLASRKNRTAKERAYLRDYLNANYPDAPG